MKEYWVEEVGEKKMGAVFYTLMIVQMELVGFLPLSPYAP